MSRQGGRRRGHLSVAKPGAKVESSPAVSIDRKTWWVRCKRCKGAVIGRYLTDVGAAGLVAEHEAHVGHVAEVEHHPAGGGPASHEAVAL